MDKKKKWSSPQAIIVMAIVLLIFTYIGFDVAKTKPAIKADIEIIKSEYKELTGFLETKLPIIDSTLKIQADQISQQSTDIGSLNKAVAVLASDPAE
jgi:hypothetical protein